MAKLQAASVPIAQAAAPWDRQTDGSRYSKIHKNIDCRSFRLSTPWRVVWFRLDARCVGNKLISLINDSSLYYTVRRTTTPRMDASVTVSRPSYIKHARLLAAVPDRAAPPPTSNASVFSEYFQYFPTQVVSTVSCPPRAYTQVVLQRSPLCNR